MGLAIVLTAAMLAFGLRAAYPAAGPPATTGDRLALALRWDLLVIACPLAMVARTAALRFFSPDAIGGSVSDHPGSAAARANAVLTNTIEQAVLAVPIHLVLAILLPQPAALVAAMALAFSVGRLLFWAGYSGGPGRRALGFALTFYPTLTGFALAAWLALAG